MKIIDPGHKYGVTIYDTGSSKVITQITFMKRKGDNYPGNIDHYPGTNCQELIRVLIDRVNYLDGQKPHENNQAIIRLLQGALWLFEDRAAEQHGIDQFDLRPDEIAEAPTCPICGHVVCKGH